jgi:hypothetical protein
MIFRTLVAYLIFFRFWCFFFFQETHTQWSQKVNLWAAILGVHITGPFLFIIIILLILLFDHFRDRLAYCLAAFSKQFEHLKQQNICPPL